MNKQTVDQKPLGEAIDSAAFEIFDSFKPSDGSFYVTDAASDNTAYLMVEGEIFSIYVSNYVLQLDEFDYEIPMDEIQWTIRFDGPDAVNDRVTVEAL